ncbi:Kinesin-like protein bimC [Golovinomyces cichoracearum]|uniref:Kinesin-like protein bimC n=1 Tax=Golovinomyces cichoracearum TaxID=62708 RepID=A0A420ILK0_9PEZI|nr:Kinesin-like protein bimC [Golovinomyces cichoracearum]
MAGSIWPAVAQSGKNNMRPPPKPLSSRHDRSGAISPAESLASVATTHSVINRRKERDNLNGDAETNINVVVRCRGRNEREVRENSGVILSTGGVKSKMLELSMGPNALSNKTYHFDKVFSSAADQAMIYDDVVAPILDEMFSGYNCTIFAYGQTGTGKTYTMSGDTTETLNMLSDSAGIIPRALYSLFTKLEKNDAEWSVKCSFIELYNEELRDLISPDDSLKLKIYDDSNTKKGHSSTIVQGMEESHIKSATEGIKLLQSGSLKRQVAATKCNDLSSRSHTVFTITTYIKRTSENGEDYISAGKLNLVDLAGSENIQRSGAENKRAVEAGLINKSLLTLGRVINALVDKNSHIPYRESKLTRLLQDSLGGRTKTCIIATVSPAKSNLEETISTLDYAFRAKNIQNKPQINQMINKRTLLKEFTVEIEKLKSELISTRQRNGVYLSNENYEEMTLQSESRRILSEEQAAKIEMMEMNLRNKVQELFSLTTSFMDLKKDNETSKVALDEVRTLLEQTEHVLETTRKSLSDETILRKAHQETEKRLNNVGSELITTLNRTIHDIDGLHAKDSRNSDLQSVNSNIWDLAQKHVSEVTSDIEYRVEEIKAQQQDLITTTLARIQNSISAELKKLSENKEFLEKNSSAFLSSINDSHEINSSGEKEMDAVLDEIKLSHGNMKTDTSQGLNELSTSAQRIYAEVVNEFGTLQTQLQNSFRSLGSDFNSLFGNLLEYTKNQRKEVEALHRQLAGATDSAIQSNITASMKLEQVLQEERDSAAADRQNLLTQITSLINAQSESQTARINNRINEIQTDIENSKEKFGVSKKKYDEEIKSWNQHETKLLEEIHRSQENFKINLEESCQATEKHSARLHDATKFVFEEILRKVGSQIEEIEKQMCVLEKSINYAKSHNARQYSGHEKTLKSLSNTVTSSFSEIRIHFSSINESMCHLHENMNADWNTALGLLESLDQIVRQPLAHLRETVSGMNLKEYLATGQTPQKVKYDFPTILPQTEDHEAILRAFHNPPDDVDSEDAPVHTKFRSVTGDKSSPPVDEQVSISLNSPSQRKQTNLNEKTLTKSSHGLREVNVNISKINNIITSVDEQMLCSKNTTSASKIGRLRGKLQVLGGRNNVILSEGRENMTDSIATNSTLIIPLETKRRRSPRIAS